MSKAEIVKAVREVMDQYSMPLTLRQIYYRLVAQNLIENKISSYKALSKILVEAREQGKVPDHKIEDRVRTTTGGDRGWESPASFINAWVSGFKDAYEQYSKTMWATQPEWIEVWVEKDALSRMVSTKAEPYNVMTCVGRGYSSYTYVKDAVRRFRAKRSKQCAILYFGDFDPSGLDITRDLQRRIADYGAGHVEVIRLALSQEQIDEYHLPPAPVKTSDSRAAGFIQKHGEGVVELDALDPIVFQAMIEDAIKAHIDWDLWTQRKEEIRTEREEIKTKMGELVAKWEDKDGKT